MKSFEVSEGFVFGVIFIWLIAVAVLSYLFVVS